MAWNFMQVEVTPEDLLVRSIIGPGGLTRDEAHAEIQALLDRGATAGLPDAVAQTWRRGAKDDTVSLGPFAWTIYEHPDGDDPRGAALAWLEGYAETMREAGLNVQVARMPPD